MYLPVFSKYIMNDDKLNRLLHSIFGVFAKTHWNPIRALFNGGVYYSLSEEDHNLLRVTLARSNYIILTYRKTHLTSYLIGIISMIKHGKWPQYTHALMNVDNETNPNHWLNFKLMEATDVGVHWSSFMQIFDCDSVCVLKPKKFTEKEWTIATNRLLTLEGTQYDNLFDLATDKRVSCVEMCRVALQSYTGYNEEFPAFEEMIKHTGNLTPQMFRDCADFEIVLEIKR
jgi:hypothetical protein